MDGHKLFRGAMWTILAVLLLVGCDAPSDEQVNITFDGKKCTVSGPSELQSGEYIFILENLTEDNLSLFVDRLLDGHTYQDWVDRLGELGNEMASSGSDSPDWLGIDAVSYAAYEKDESTGEETLTLRLKRDGDFAISIRNQDSSTVWPCGPLKVVAAPSE